MWKSVPGATSYRVTVYDSTLKNIVASSGPILESQWTAERELQRGSIFAWKLTVLRDGQEFFAPRPPALPPDFRVLDVERFDELTRAKKECGESHLILGILYAQAGLRSEAEKEFEALAAANPRSPVAAKLLESVRLSSESQQ